MKDIYKCRNCGNEQNVDSHCKMCLMSNFESINNTDFSGIKEIKATQSGDDSVGINGSISFKDKDSAIMFIQGLMETFDISSKDIDY